MRLAADARRMDHTARAELRLWLLLALGALAVAGGLALALAASRTPGVQDSLPWGTDAFYRFLVTHVVFSFQLWLLAMLGALSVPRAARPAGRALGRAGVALAGLGAVLLLVPTLSGEGAPSLNNYVPVLVHPLYYVGLATVAAGVALAAVRRLAGPWPLAVLALCLLSALACFALAALLIPAGTDIDHANERLFWGGGHVLQLVNTGMLLWGWQVLARRLWGVGALPPLLERVAFAGLALAAVAAPFAYGLDVLGLAHRQAFTALLWVALPLPAGAMGAGLLWRVLCGPRSWQRPELLALVLSLAVFGLGGLAGFGLGVADTRTPSHYHAVIGGVNLVLMGLFHAELLPALGHHGGGGRWLRAQFWLYGGGQALHALGFFAAGLAGVARKTAGAEQGLDSAAKLAAMGLVGVGGAVAVLGGVVFVVHGLGCLLRRGDGHG